MLILILTALFLYLFHELYWKRRHLPPGPIPLPLLGNFLTLDKFSPGYEAYKMWSEKFGSVYTIWLGMDPAVIITDFDIIKKHIVQDGDSYADRAQPVSDYYFKLFKGGDGKSGVVDTNGELWKRQRRFALHTLRDFGMGRNVMEEKVLTEVDTLLSRIAAVDSSPVNVASHIDTAVGSVINNLLFGHGFDTEKRLSEFFELKAIITELMGEWGDPMSTVIAKYPHLRHIPCKPFNTFYPYLAERRERIYGYFRRQIDQHEIDYDTEESTDFIEAFLKQQKKQKDLEGKDGEFNDLQLENMCLDLWIAGMETSSNTIVWAVVYLLRHPECQRRMREEMTRQLPGARRVTMADRPRLPYVCAVINEVQRLANLVPTNLIRATTRDVVIEGHPVPAGTIVIPQISSVMYDEKHFPDPHVFNPDRFIAPDGSLLKIDQLVPFSIGKRACLGESLARMELFLFITNLFFRYEMCSNGALPSDEKRPGLTVSSHPFTAILHRRE